MEDLYTKVTSQVKLFVEENCDGCCISILGGNGDELIYLKLGEPTPCSITLSRKKAFTAYSFKKNNDDVYQDFSNIGSQPLINRDYCFISGGVHSKNCIREDIYIGVSTDKPSLDKKIAMEISKTLRGSI